MGLSNYQLVLLDNLIYLDTVVKFQDQEENYTVRDIINALLYESVQTSDGKIKYGLIEEDYTSKGTGEPKSMMSKEEWIAVLKAIEADPILCALEIHNVTDVAGNGFRAATFISEATQENVVIFKGTTTAEEWIDNGEGGYSLQTENQKMALDYVNNLDIVNNNSFITSGHSKGGNLATYVTLFSTDTLLDKCLSFDGQGFSQELCDSEEYQRAMEKNGNNLYLVASNCDYVNVLFNPAVPENHRMYLEANDVGMNAAKFHAPNNVLSMDAEGNITGLNGTGSISIGSYMIRDLIGYITKNEPDAEKKAVMYGALMDIMAATSDNNDGIKMATGAGIAKVVIELFISISSFSEVNKDINMSLLNEIVMGDTYTGEICELVDSGTLGMLAGYVSDYAKANTHNLYAVLSLANDYLVNNYARLDERLMKLVRDKIWDGILEVFNSEYQYTVSEFVNELNRYNVGSNTLGEGIPGTTYYSEKEDGGMVFRGNGGFNSITGSSTNDYLHGGNGVDFIYGGAGDDVIFGGRGNDSLNGEGGNDIYVINKYDGRDIILNSGSENELNFIYLNEGINCNEVEYKKDGNDLHIKYNKDYPEDCIIIVKNFFTDDGNGNLLYAVDAIVFDSGSMLDVKEIFKLVDYEGVTGKTMIEKLDSVSNTERERIFEEYEFLREIYKDKYNLVTEVPLTLEPDDDKSDNVEEEKTKGEQSKDTTGGETSRDESETNETVTNENDSSGNSDDDERKKSSSAAASAATANVHNAVKDAEYETIGKEPDKYHEATFNTYVDPVVIDLNGDGEFTTSLEKGVHFDFNGDSFAEKTAWVSAGDGLLVRDVNQNGMIDNGSELFGDQTVLKDGTIAASGFQALTDLDDNKDGVLDNSDTGFKEMKVWVDFDHDGVSSKEELYSLNQLGIISIDLANNVINQFDTNGNLIKSQGILGGICNNFNINEYGFTIDYVDTVYRGDEIDTSNLPDYLPEIKGCGTLLDLSKAMVVNEQLKNLVESFVSEREFMKKNALAQDILFCWAGVTEIDAGSRGGRIDARRLGVLEKVYGKSFVGVSGSNPIVGAADILNGIYVELLEDVKNRLLVQTVYNDAIQAIDIQYDNEKEEFVCDFVSVMEKLTSENPDFTVAYFTDYLLKYTDVGNYFDKTYIINQLKMKNNLWGEYLLANNIIGTGSENDILNGGNGNDLLYGGSGDDVLNGGGGYDTYVFNLGDGADVINNYDPYNWRGDRIVFGEGILAEDMELYRSGHDLIFKNKTNGDSVTLRNATADCDGWYYIGSVEFADGTKWDAAYIQENTRHYTGTDGDDVLNGLGGGYNYNQNETFEGGSGNDTINGNDGNDEIDGGSGNDVLNGGNGNDLLYGGSGDDVLNGGGGYDTYVFNLGDGADVINNYDPYNWRGDRIVFGEGILAEDMELYRSGHDLIFKNKTNGDCVTLRNATADCDGWYYIGSVEFADGTKWDAAYIQENTRHYTGTDGDDVLNGLGGGYNYNQNETFEGGSGNDTINGNDGNDEIDGGSENDILNGGNGNDLLYGGSGDDVLNGGGGYDTYVFNLGDGADVINNYDPYNWRGDRIVFGEGILAEDMELYRSGHDLIFKNKTNGDSVTLRNATADCDGWYYIGSVEFADGTKWDAAYIQENTRHYTGTDGDDVLNGLGGGYNYNQNETFEGGSGNDTINGNDGNDEIDGGSGNDVLNGGNGNDLLYGGSGDDVLNGGGGYDTYVFNLGDGADVINNYDPYNWRGDRIVFGEGILAEDMELYRSGHDLIFKNKTNGDCVTLRNATADCDGWYYIGSVEFADGTKWDAAYIQENTRHYTGTDGDDVLNGLGGGYNYNQNETFEGGSGNDTINGNDGNDEIDGGSGNDVLNGGNGNDLLYGGSGDDVLNGGGGYDTYVFNLGDGADVINNYDPYNWRGDRIVFGEGILAEDMELYRSGHDLIFKNKTNGDCVTLRNATADCDGWYYIGSVEFADGTKWDAAYIQENTRHYTGTDGDDVLNGLGGGYNYNQNETFEGGSGNDTLQGGYGDDIYIFNRGDGQDRIEESSGRDILLFGKDITKEQLRFTREGNHLRVSVIGTEDSILITNQYYSSYNQIESFKTSDGSIFDYTKIDLMIQAMASFEETTGMMWEEAIEKQNEQANDIVNQWWTKEAI